MALITVFWLSLIEGVTEFLPVSSTGHMVLFANFLGLDLHAQEVASFILLIQLGAILAVFAVFLKNISKNEIYKVMTAFVPTAIVGFLLYKVVKTILITDPLIVAFALLIGGVIMLLTDKFLFPKVKIIQNGKVEELSYLRAAFIGLFQALSVIPGVSRAMVSILGGRITGLAETEAIRFSFLLATPTIAAATAYDLYKTGFSNTNLNWQTGLGFVLAFIFAYLVVKFFNKHYQKLSFTFFGWYRVILGGVVLLFLL